ncbi:MAG: GGDEF domain-containing protein [Mobilitalea sp.]
MKWKSFIAVILGLVIIVAVGLLGLNMKRDTEQLSTKYEEAQLRSTTELITKEINMSLTGYLGTVETISKIIAQEDNHDWEQNSLVTALKSIHTQLPWKAFNICDVNGLGVDLEGKEQKVAFCSYYQRALTGETVISLSHFYETDDYSSIVYTTPIYQNDKIIGVIRASMDIETLQDMMGVNTFRGKEEIFLVLQDGTILLNQSGEALETADLFSLLDKDNTNYSELKQIMKQGKTTLAEVKMQNVSTLLSYSGIKDISNGGILIIIPKNQLEVLYEETLTTVDNRVIIALFVLTLSCSLFLVLFVLIECAKRSRVEGLAYFDEITSGINYNRFKKDALELINKSGDINYAVIELAIDRFEYINEFFGTQESNRILKHISDVLHDNIKADELFCRLNTEYFVLLLKYHNKNELSDRIGFIDMKIGNFEGQENKNEKYEMRLHYGIYCLENDDSDLDLMISRANYALFMVKYDKNQMYEYYNGVMQNKIIDEKEIEAHMYTALDEKEFLVYLQPKFDLKTGMQVGAEALVRWMHPEKGLMYPGRFIGVLEKNGFIVKLDMYILDEICHKLKIWIGKGYRPMPVSINISRLNLFDVNFIDNIEATLEKYGVPANLIILEISEEVVSDNKEILASLMKRLKDFGFLISMDDFGTGTTSMNTLYHVPIDELKLDRKFLLGSEKTNRGINIIQSIIETAKRLDIKVVSEGVENKIQANMLKELGCDMIQGFVFSDPLPLREYEDYAYGARAKDNKITL